MDSILEFFNTNIIGILILFAAGLVFIVKGGDIFVDAASWLAEVSGIPKFIIGATVVSFATTLPELLTSLFATLDGVKALGPAGEITEAASGFLAIATGNAVGSVTANIGLIMGISLVCIPSEVIRKQFAPQAIIMIISAAVLCIFGATGYIGLAASAILLALFALFMYNNIRNAIKNKEAVAVEIQGERPSPKVVFTNVAKFVVGAAGIVLGADMLVDYGSKIAEISGIPDEIIAITLIAVGTSLPELVTTLTAIAKKQASLSVGNIIGANVFDLTLILSVCAFASGGKLTINEASYMLDMPVCLGVGIVAVLPPLIKGRFYRWQGIALLVIYAAYITAACLI